MPIIYNNQIQMNRHIRCDILNKNDNDMYKYSIFIGNLP